MSELSDLTLKFSARDKTGTSASNQIRAQGRIPAVLYSKEMNRALSVEDKEMRLLLRKASGTSSLMRLIGESGEDELVLIKELQQDKIRDRIIHIDFVQVKRGEDLQTSVPLSIVGEAEGVKVEGGILEVLANDIEIRCRPSKLPSLIEINITDLGLGGNLQIKDLPKLDGVEYVAPDDLIIVSCVGSASGRSGSDDEDSAGEEDSGSDAASGEDNPEDKNSPE
jgi:large subunit ribosomal protein L25